jgi:hypothetical protein
MDKRVFSPRRIIMRALLLVPSFALALTVGFSKPAHASTSTVAHITFIGGATSISGQQAGGNIFLSLIFQGIMAGDVTGTWTNTQVNVGHPNGTVTITGTQVADWTFGGRSGTVNSRFSVSVVPNRPTFIQGTFVILSATRDLANLRGEGTVDTASPTGFSVTLSLHFEP